MIVPNEALAAPSREEALSLLEDTARTVKVMKASWLRVALNLQKIKRHDLWKFVDPPCENFEGYVYGVLDIQRGVARRMLEAVDYAAQRRPKFVDDVEDGRDIHVPSYDTLNQLRRAEGSFEGRETEFDEIEQKVFQGELGRARLRREIEEKLDPPEPEDDSNAGPPPFDVETESGPPPGEGPLTLDGALKELQRIESELLNLDVSKETRRLMFQLIEALQKEVNGARPAPA
ncbi:MAG: hypothetical protein AAF517_18870 [Planctomycetota bacterium]